MPDSDRIPKPPRAPQRNGGPRAARARPHLRGTGGAPSLRMLVEEHPWAMVGAAAGAGLAIGMQSRKLAGSDLGNMLVATVTGLATKLAMRAMAEMLEQPPEPREV